MLIANWRQVLLRAWSIRLLALSILLSAVEFALPYLDGILPVERGVFAALAFVTSIAAAIARVLAQKDVD